MRRRKIEDLHHVAVECPKYVNLRKDADFLQNINKSEFNAILQNTCISHKKLMLIVKFMQSVDEIRISKKSESKKKGFSLLPDYVKQARCIARS